MNDEEDKQLQHSADLVLTARPLVHIISTACMHHIYCMQHAYVHSAEHP